MPQSKQDDDQAIDELAKLSPERRKAIFDSIPLEKQRKIILRYGARTSQAAADRKPTGFLETHPVIREGLLGASAGTGVPETGTSPVQTLTAMGKGIVNTFTPQSDTEKGMIAADPINALSLPLIKMGKGIIEGVYGAGGDIGEGLYRGITKTGDQDRGFPLAAHGAGQLLTTTAGAVLGAKESERPGAGTLENKTLGVSVPHKMINKLIKPMASDVRFGKNPAKAIVDEGIVGNSLPELGAKTFEKIHEVGKQIDQVLQSPEASAKQVNVADSLSPVDEAMKKAVKDGDKGLYDRLGALKQQLTQEWQEFTPEGSTQSTIRPTGPRNLTMTPYEATQFKRLVGDSTKWTGTDPFEENLNAVKGEVYGNLKNDINKAVPKVKELNERYANLVGAGKAIERRIPVAERHAEWSLSDIAAAGVGGVPLAVGRRLLGTAGFKTRAAQALKHLAPAENPVPLLKQRGDDIVGHQRADNH